MVTLKSKKYRFILRHIRLSDYKDFFECFQDKDARMNYITYPKNLKEAKRKVTNKIAKFKNKKGETFVIEIKGKFAGFVEINELNRGFFKHRANIGYCTHKDFRRKGIATAAVKLVVRHAFKKYKLVRLEGMCRTFNKTSAKLLKKTGFKLEGILRKNKCVNGKFYDDMLWAKVK